MFLQQKWLSVLGLLLVAGSIGNPAAAAPRVYRVDMGAAGRGPYLVTMTGNRTSAAGLTVTAEGKPITLRENMSPTTGKFENLQFDVPAVDGVLDLTIDDSADTACRSIKQITVVPANAAGPIAFTAPAGLGLGRLVKLSSQPLGVPDGTLITVKPNVGAIVTPDAAPSVAGHQVAVAGGVISLTVELPPRPAAIVIDNTDPGFAKTGAWTQLAGPGFRNSQSVAPAGNGANTATWTVANLVPGAAYQVSATWAPQSTQATRASYAVRYNLPGGAEERLVASVNQALAPADFIDQRIAWTVLATATPATDTLSVQLTDLADRSVVADAIRVQQIGGPLGDLQIAVTDDQGVSRGLTVFPLNRCADEMNFDLESSLSAPDGYVGVGRQPYDAGLGYGWLAPVTTFDRGVISPDLLMRDGHYGSTDNVFRVQLEPGTDYKVTLRFWDTWARDGMQVFVGNEINPRAEVAYLPPLIATAQSFCVSSAELTRTGWLDLRFHDVFINGGGGDPFWIINAIEIMRLPHASAVNGPAPATPVTELPPPSGD